VPSEPSLNFKVHKTPVSNSSIHLIDTHAHLDEQRFNADRATVVARAAAIGVDRIITIATTLQGSLASLAIAREFTGVSASIGIHPNYVAEAQPGDWDQVVALARDPFAVAIGETGLDRFHEFSPFPLQEDYFARHLALGRQVGKPAVIHCRDCEADVLKMLRAEFDKNGPILAVMHSFAGAAETAAACLEMGLYISFSGMLTYKKSDALRSIAAQIPPNRLLVETDSPYLAPVPKRGERNEPAFVVHTAGCLAELHYLEPSRLAELTTQNAIRLFKLGAIGAKIRSVP
jgi:TatD DNase family protein